MSICRARHAGKGNCGVVFYWIAAVLLVLCCGCAGRQNDWQGYDIPPAPADAGKTRLGEEQLERRSGTAGTELRGGYDADGRYVGRYDSGDREDSRSSREDIRRDSGRIQEKTGGLPATYHEFKERYMREAVTPEGAVKLYFDAVFCYIDPAARTEGVKMLRYCLREKRDWEKTAFYRTFVERMENPEYTHIFHSFAAGTSVENGYAMSPDNYRLDIAKIWDKHPSGDLQVMLRSSGADSPRPVYIRKYDGLWFIANNAATYTGVRRPETERDRTGHDADYDDVNYRSGY